MVIMLPLGQHQPQTMNHLGASLISLEHHLKEKKTTHQGEKCDKFIT